MVGLIGKELEAFSSEGAQSGRQLLDWGDRIGTTSSLIVNLLRLPLSSGFSCFPPAQR